MIKNAHDPGPSAPLAEESQPPGGTLEQEHGGPAGLEPTRYGDWEKKGRCIDF